MSTIMCVTRWSGLTNINSRYVHFPCPQYNATQIQAPFLYNSKFKITFSKNFTKLLYSSPCGGSSIYMGNHISLRDPSSDATGKIVFFDGWVREFDEPLTVAELMLEHPQQVVVEFHSALNQKRPTPLPADKELEMNKVYLMLPMKRGKPVGLSGEETRRILLILNSAMHNSKYFECSSRFLPWFARLCQNSITVGEGGTGVVRKEEVMKKKEERYEFSEFLPEMLEGRPEYLSRQLSSGKGWKPSLDTIEEKKIDRKLNHWLFLNTSH